MKVERVYGAYHYAYPIINEDISAVVGIMIRAIEKKLKNKHINLVCTGTSGLYIATVMKTQRPDKFSITYIRKEGVSAHGGSVIKIRRQTVCKMWVDDFIASGATYKFVRDKLDRHGMTPLTHAMTLGGGDVEEEMVRDGIKIYFKGS